jgi:aminoglycoside phosphotransferase (APT) family kinase protein
LSLVFPLAGREGGDFRALQEIGGESLIHRALASFTPFRNRIGAVHCLVLREHEEHVRRLQAEMAGFDVRVTLLETPTAGPAETVSRGILAARLGGPAIVCDLDHRLDLAPLFAAMDEAPQATLVSLWPLAGEDLKRWSVAAVSGAGSLAAVAERSLPSSAGFFQGVIGCYYFPDIASVARLCGEKGLARFSGYFNHLSAGSAPARGVRLEKAEFFGDAERIRALEGKAGSGTIFCDIDGTLIRHEDRADYGRLPELLPGSREKLRAWIADGYRIVLCTARAAADKARLEAALAALEIPYHDLLCGLPSGIRVLVNDRKPQAIFASQAMSLEIARDAGIGKLEIRPPSRPQILRRFEGGSFAETLLLEEEGRHFVRKRVAKDGNLSRGYGRLRDQFRTLERFGLMDRGLVPALLGEENNSHEYFYDMEYLAGHVPLADAMAPDALEQLFDRLERHLYSHRNGDGGAARAWLLRHLETKIDPKIGELNRHPALQHFLAGEEVIIDGVVRPSLTQLMAEIRRPEMLAKFTPQFLSLVHGDLTFQNVMLGPDLMKDGVKLIDMEAQESLEAPELDLGKMFQSIFSQYETWSAQAAPLCTPAPGGIALAFAPGAPDIDLVALVARRWARILDCSEDEVALKGRFYLGLHLVRMVPFRLKRSPDQASYAMATALVQLHRAVQQAQSRGGARARRAA